MKWILIILVMWSPTNSSPSAAKKSYLVTDRQGKTFIVDGAPNETGNRRNQLNRWGSAGGSSEGTRSRSHSLEQDCSSESLESQGFTDHGRDIVRNCRLDESDSLHNYASEDIEKMRNISLSDYQGSISLVVNLASF